jgi:hypothetical protein
VPILNPAPSWNNPRNAYIELWHGCTSDDQKKIESSKIDPSLGRPNTDFGRGFYTTTIKRQARHWAWARFYDPMFRRKTGIQPVVLRFNVPRHDLASLTCICFGIGAYNNKDFWSLVQHCRQSKPKARPPVINDHAGPVNDGPYKWYEIACGPVAAFWQQRSAMHDADQISFHTANAAQILTDLINSGDTTKYDWEPVP